MSSISSTHPSAEYLLQWIWDHMYGARRRKKVSEAEFDALARHILSCAACQAELRDLLTLQNLDNSVTSTLLEHMTADFLDEETIAAYAEMAMENAKLAYKTYPVIARHAEQCPLCQHLIEDTQKMLDPIHPRHSWEIIRQPARGLPAAYRFDPWFVVLPSEIATVGASNYASQANQIEGSAVRGGSILVKVPNHASHRTPWLHLNIILSPITMLKLRITLLLRHATSTMSSDDIGPARHIAWQIEQHHSNGVVDQLHNNKTNGDGLSEYTLNGPGVFELALNVGANEWRVPLHIHEANELAPGSPNVISL